MAVPTFTKTKSLRQRNAVVPLRPSQIPLRMSGSIRACSISGGQCATKMYLPSQATEYNIGLSTLPLQIETDSGSDMRASTDFASQASAHCVSVGSCLWKVGV